MTEAAAPAFPGVEEPTVRRFGRELPRAGAGERMAWGVALAFVLGVLATAAFLEPSPRGVGTHEQLPFFGGRMKPCGFLLVTGYPCPSCGYTTTFALAAHGRVVEAARNQPFGFVVFLLSCLSIPAAGVAAFGGVSLARLTDLWPWKRIAAAVVLLWLLAWLYKIELMGPPP